MLAERLQAALREPIALQDATCFAQASIGLAVYPQDGADAESLLAQRRHRDVSREDRGSRQRHVFRGKHESRCAAATAHRAAAARRTARARTDARLSGASEPGRRFPVGRRSAGPLDGFATRRGLAGRVHPSRGRMRADRRARHVGPARSLLHLQQAARAGIRAGTRERQRLDAAAARRAFCQRRSAMRSSALA